MLSLNDFRSLLTSGELFPVHAGRHYVALSLAEAETVRKILHVRRGKKVLDNCSTELALRYSPIASPGVPTAGDGGIIFDTSAGWKQGTGATQVISF